MDLQLIADYGVYFYLLVFIWTFFEGETIVLFAGFAAAQGLLDPLLLLVCAGLGSYLGDQCYFWLGRNYGVRNFSSFALGLSAVRWERFLRLNFLAAMVWAASFVAIGYFHGHAFSTAVNIANWLGYVLLGVFVALGCGIW